MERLRTTFKRSRTPTGAEMKTQSSLEVPKQVRSASFDEMQLEAKRLAASVGESLLTVPTTSGQRSKSVDSAADETNPNFLEVPSRKYNRRRSSADKPPVFCVHCQYIDDITKFHQSISVEEESVDLSSESLESLLTSSSDEEETASASFLFPPMPFVTVTLSPNSEPSQESVQNQSEDTSLDTSTEIPTPDSSGERRKSITSPKLSRQEALVVVDTKDSLESVPDTVCDSDSDLHRRIVLDDSGLQIEELRMGGSDGDVQASCVNIFLTVPELKRDRAASVDSCFSKLSQTTKAEEVKVDSLEPPGSSARSRSVDIVLPTDEQARYKALAMSHRAAQPPTRGRPPGSTETAVERAFRVSPDWTDTALNGDHLWGPTSASGDFCYVGENDCTKHGPRMKCAACKIIAHASCIPILMDRIKFLCKPTFRDVGVRQYREHTAIQHHWVHRRSQKGKCGSCGKSFQSKLSFSSKEIVALSCSWCKTAYHNKETCFNIKRVGEECPLGEHKNIIVPPSWIVKLPRCGSFKSSLRKSPKKKQVSRKRSKEKTEKDPRSFVIKPIPSASVKPVIVFINPKSGGNQGVKLMQKFQWLLNPRQVFDLTQGGPKMGLEMYRKVINLRVLACGGDGTVGWILSILDNLNLQPQPAVGVLPLGTGNDLARALGWGGGYTDEPIGKILSNIAESEVSLLDRWQLKVEPNPDGEVGGDEGKPTLPLNVVNNYFSLGVDAHIALEFHEAREAHPEKFNSRLRNKMFYGQMGGKDLLKRKWKDLSEFVKLECDGKDLTSRLKEHKVHAIVFLNIPSYGGGTRPWNRAAGQVDPATDDGLIEVIGLTTYQLPLLQAGGHGTCITQCKEARIITSKTIPMQVDGEACRLLPSIISLSLLNKVSMLVKRKGGPLPVPPETLDKKIRVSVQKIGMSDYEQHHYDKDLLRQAAVEVGSLDVCIGADLENVRALIRNMLMENRSSISPDWCFVDSCTAERFFRVDRAQEHLHYLTDIASDIVFILDPADGPDASDDEWGSRFNGARPPEERRIADITRSKSAEGIASETRGRPKMPRSPSAGPGLAVRSREEQIFGQWHYPLSYRNLLEKTTDSVIKAAKLGDVKMLRELHSQGYSLLSIDSTGQTALHYAAKCGHKDVVKFLIANAPPALLNMADNEKGQTALHKAAFYKRRSICCMLVAGGASLTLKDHGGRTPRALALVSQDPDLAAYLESQEQFQSAAVELETVV